MGLACGTCGERKSASRDLVGKPEKRDYSNDVDVDGMIKLKWIINRLGGCGLGCVSE